MRSAYPQQKKKKTPTHTMDHIIRRRSSSRCSISDMDFICSMREGDEEFSSINSGMSFLGGAGPVHRWSRGGFAAGGYGAGRGLGRRLNRIGAFCRQQFVALFFQTADFALDLGGEFVFSALKFGQGLADHAAQLGQLARTKQYQRQQKDKKKFRLHRSQLRFNNISYRPVKDR